MVWRYLAFSSCLEHVHEGAVVDPVHAQGPDEIPFHQPEGLGQQQCTRHLDRHPVHHLAPELDREDGVELLAAHAMLGTGRDAAPQPAHREPEALEVLLGQGHGGVETDDREVAGHMQDGLDDRLAHLGDQVVELGGVVPGDAGAVIAVIDVAGTTSAALDQAEDHGGVGLGPVAVLDLDDDICRSWERSSPLNW